MAEPTIKVTSLPPERRPKPRGTVLHCCGCCCCCCCLHTLGGVIGAAVAPAFGSNRGPIQPRYRLLVEEYEFDDAASGISSIPTTAAPLRRPLGVSGVAVYWWVMLALVFGAVVLGLATGGGDAIGVAIFGLALGLPGLQLLALFLAALVIVASVREDKKLQLLQVGKITLGCVVGTVLGILAMVGMAGGLSVLK